MGKNALPIAFSLYAESGGARHRARLLTLHGELATERVVFDKTQLGIPLAPVMTVSVAVAANK